MQKQEETGRNRTKNTKNQDETGRNRKKNEKQKEIGRNKNKL